MAHSGGAQWHTQEGLGRLVEGHVLLLAALHPQGRIGLACGDLPRPWGGSPCCGDRPKQRLVGVRSGLGSVLARPCELPPVNIRVKVTCYHAWARLPCYHAWRDLLRVKPQGTDVVETLADVVLDVKGVAALGQDVQQVLDGGWFIASCSSSSWIEAPPEQAKARLRIVARVSTGISNEKCAFQG